MAITYSKTCTVHGPTVTGHEPVIKFQFTVSITRNGANVYLALSNMTFWTVNGGYGYPLSLYAIVTNGSQVRLDKSTATTNTKWTRHPSNRTLVSPNNISNTVKMSIGVYSVDKKRCYSKNPTWVKQYTFTAPEYDKKYIITYDSRGGIDGPEPQEFSSQNGGEITDIVPTYPITITYHSAHEAPDPTLTNLTFNTDTSWDTDGSTMSTVSVLHPGEFYPGSTISGNLTVYANWNPATFLTRQAEEYYLVTLDAGEGGTVTPPSLHVSRPCDGYATSPDGAVVYFQNTQYTTSSSLDLYPICGRGLLLYSMLPKAADVHMPGYTFEGWYTDPAYAEGTKVTTDMYLTSDITLYARYYKSSLWIKEDDGTDTGRWRRLYDELDWQRAPKVYMCVDNNGTREWQKVAQMYRCVEVNGQRYWEEW